MTHLLAHLARRTLQPTTIRPRPPALFEATPAVAPALEPLSQAEVMETLTPRSTGQPEQMQLPVTDIPKVQSESLSTQSRTPSAVPLQEKVSVMPVNNPPIKQSAAVLATTRVPLPDPLQRQPVREFHQSERLITKEITQLQQRELAHVETRITRETQPRSEFRESVLQQTERLLVAPAQLSQPVLPPAAPIARQVNSAIETPVPQVEIHIGRIEVRPVGATTAAAPTPAQEAGRVKAQSLDDYLQGRSRSTGGRP